MNFTKKSLRLYAVTDRSWLHGETLYEQVEKALKGGVTLVQLREKELSEADFEQEAKELLELCHKYNVNLIINDNVELAAKVGADGVHIGQSDKKDAKPMDHALLQEICESVKIPVVAIGGIDGGNILLLKDRKMAGVAVVSGLFACEDIKKAAEDLREKADRICE